jgi:hypothetical protein
VLSPVAMMISAVLPGLPTEASDKIKTPLLLVTLAEVTVPVPIAEVTIGTPKKVSTPPFTAPEGRANVAVATIVEPASSTRKALEPPASIKADKAANLALIQASEYAGGTLPAFSGEKFKLY